MNIFYRVSLTGKMVLAQMRSAKMRTGLTILGVVIGIASVMVVMSVGESAQSLILDQVRGIGTNLIAVLPGASEEDEPPAAVFGIAITTLTNDDLAALSRRENVAHLSAISGYAIGSVRAKYKDRAYQTSVYGVSAAFPVVENASVAAGRFFNDGDDESLSRVVVLGATRANDLFGDQNPTGKTIRLGDTSFRVIGVLKERGAVAFSSPDTTAFVPLRTAQKLLLGFDYLSFIRAQVEGEEYMESVRTDITALLRDRHNLEAEEPNDFSVRSATAALSLITTITDALKYFLVSVAAVALVVGGVGIMNILLIALSQRVRDIGLRKALGALNRDIFAQFLLEAVIVSLIGALLGIVLGAAVISLVAVSVQSLGYEWPLIITFNSVVIAIGISLFIGTVFGLYPARKAVKISPTEALRYE